MEHEEVIYYCDESPKTKEKWYLILTEAFSKADAIGFNVHNKENEFWQLDSELIEKNVSKRRIYNSGRDFYLYKPSNKVKTIVQSKDFLYWALGTFEDISFWEDGVEIFSTISHENYLIARLTSEQRNHWNNLGFDFAFDWGTDPSEEFENESSISLIDRLKKLVGIKNTS